jgi:hypothetical protein
MFDTDLPKFAESLRSRGLDARADIFRTESGGPQKGLRVGEHFYPLWELNLKQNRDALSRLDLDEIRSRRGPNWTVVRPIKLGEQC